MKYLMSGIHTDIQYNRESRAAGGREKGRMDDSTQAYSDCFWRVGLLTGMLAQVRGCSTVVSEWWVVMVLPEGGRGGRVR